MSNFPNPATKRRENKGRRLYYAYLTIPPEYRPLFNGRKQIKRSLGTTDERLASKLLRDKEAEIIEEIRKKDYDNHPLVKVALDIQKSLWREIRYQASDWTDAKTKTVAYLDVMEEANKQIMAGINTGTIKYVDPKGEEIDSPSQYFRKYLGKGLMTKSNDFAIDRVFINSDRTNDVFSHPEGTDVYKMVITSPNEPSPDLSLTELYDAKVNAEPLMQLKIQLERLFIEYSDEKSLPTKQGKFVSEVIDEYLQSTLFTSIGRNKTKGEYLSKLKIFKKWAGYQTIDQLEPQSPYEYINALLDPSNPLSLGKTRAEDGVPSNGTIKKYLNPVKRVFKFATRNGYIDTNPFSNVEAKGYGHKQVDRIDWTDEQLRQLFNLDLRDRERLVLTLMAITGFRLDEVALLRWEQISEVNGILCLDLTGVDVTVKTDSSARLLPIPDKFIGLLLPKGEGSLFDYRRDSDGKAQNHASRECMEYVRMVTTDPRCDNHSLRHTFKTKLRNSGIDETLINFLMGHNQDGVKYGQAHNLDRKLEAMNKLAEEQLGFINTPRLTDERTIKGEPDGLA